MNKIMILGAGIYQVPLIRKAKELGLFTIVASYPGKYPGFSYADKVVFCDTRDLRGILSAAREEGIDGIATTGTDVAVPALAHVCSRLGLCGLSPEAAEKITDKAAMKAAFDGRVRTAAFRTVRTYEEALAAASAIGFPVMVKACDVSGSRGITRVTEEDAVLPAFREAERVSRTDHFIVEEFIRGVEFGVDGFVSGGQLRLCLPHEKDVFRAGETTIPAGHAFPFSADAALLEKIRSEMENIIAATGIDNCAFNADVMLTEDNDIRVIEAGARCGATGIPELISLHTGIDYYKQILLCALGEPLSLEISRGTPCRSKLLFSRRGGIVKAIDRAALDAMIQDPSNKIVSVDLDVAPGDEIHPVQNGTDRFGQLLLSTDEKAPADEAAERVLSCIDY